ncbi:uncharacterized protein [Venturia canescens]|uniref:uncharacterized protein isoform X2 n=1 Tax=Venturia canescens TaxID=32260 RepID=UPI001C9CA814|nr:uncharacterized protein LOC122408033 isoform X2 [Venturia canescens]
MPISLSVSRKLNSAIKKFRFEELENCVLHNFPETSWNRIRSTLIKNHQKFTVSNVLNIIEEAIHEAKVSETVLNDRIANLDIINISRHHSKKTWYTFKMLTQKSERQGVLTKSEIKTKIVQQFEKHQLKVDVRVIDYESLTFISIIDKPKDKRKSHRVLPFFFAMSMELEFLFCSRINPPKDFLQILVESFGYTSFKVVKLVGRDLHSLIQILRMKMQGAVDSENYETPRLKPAAPVVTSSGIDFRQNKQRREYAEQCFGKEPPTLELLVATGPERPWVDDEINMKMPDENVQIRSIRFLINWHEEFVNLTFEIEIYFFNYLINDL